MKKGPKTQPQFRVEKRGRNTISCGAPNRQNPYIGLFLQSQLTNRTYRQPGQKATIAEALAANFS
jgi:hypothetical protein